ncbi:unnamed protein product, partial [Gulo gulo]
FPDASSLAAHTTSFGKSRHLTSYLGGGSHPRQCTRRRLPRPSSGAGKDGKDGILARPQTLVLLVTWKSADGTGHPGGWGLGPGWARGGSLPWRLEVPHHRHRRGPSRLPTSPPGAPAPHMLTPMYTHSHTNARTHSHTHTHTHSHTHI